MFYNMVVVARVGDAKNKIHLDWVLKNVTYEELTFKARIAVRIADPDVCLLVFEHTVLCVGARNRLVAEAAILRVSRRLSLVRTQSEYAPLACARAD